MVQSHLMSPLYHLNFPVFRQKAVMSYFSQQRSWCMVEITKTNSVVTLQRASIRKINGSPPTIKESICTHTVLLFAILASIFYAEYVSKNLSTQNSFILNVLYKRNLLYFNIKKSPNYAVLYTKNTYQMHRIMRS